MKQTIKHLYNKFRHLILYGIIGGFCATLDFGIYTLLCHFDILPYLWANVISIHCGIICSFLLNRTFNFKVKDKTPQRFVSFYVVGLIGLGISELMLYVMVTIGGWNELLCKLISVVIVAAFDSPAFINPIVNIHPHMHNVTAAFVFNNDNQ